MPDGVHKYYFSDRMNFTGIGDLIVPLVLGGLIVFSTMLGSVVEREKEIFTFSALGLAPPHVATLFFAEACIYAVLGGLGGYLLGQAFVTVLTFLSTHYGIVRVPNVNYSSSTAIVTILIVMATVLLLDPSIPRSKLLRSANPGVTRTWKIPAAAGRCPPDRLPVHGLRLRHEGHRQLPEGVPRQPQRHFAGSVLRAERAEIVKLDVPAALLGLQAQDLAQRRSTWVFRSGSNSPPCPSEIPGIHRK